MLYILVILVLANIVFTFLVYKNVSAKSAPLDAFTTPQAKPELQGRLELCEVCQKLKNDVKMTRENRRACHLCRVTVLHLAD